MVTTLASLPAATRRRYRAPERGRAFRAVARAASGTPYSRAWIGLAGARPSTNTNPISARETDDKSINGRLA